MAPKIVLYGPANAPYTEKCRRGLVLKGLDFELREPSGPEDYKRWSPHTGLLPVMRLDGELVSDSTEILRKLDEIAPEPSLVSADAVVASQQRNLEDWADESFLWYFQQWLRLNRAAEESRAATEAGRPTGPPSESARRWALLRRALAWLRAGGTWERPETAILRGIDDRLADLVNFLGSRDFFYSDRVSIADLAVYGMLYTLRRNAIPGSAPLLARRPQLIEFMRRLESATGGS